nr:MAG TPA: hypothetical protein [Caudoviricetes sp.]
MDSHYFRLLSLTCHHQSRVVNLRLTVITDRFGLCFSFFSPFFSYQSGPETEN